MRYTWLTIAVAVSAMACQQTAEKKDSSTKSSKENDPLFTNRDTTISPGEDFFLYANGGWIKNTPIPESEASWGIGNLVQLDIYSARLNGAQT